jgi:hypothetical protein
MHKKREDVFARLQTVVLAMLLAAIGIFESSCDHGGSSSDDSGNNSTPTAQAGLQATLDEDTPTRITLGGSDADGDPLRYSISAGPAHGSVTLDGRSATYTPDLNYNGADSFSYTVSDNTSTSSAESVALTVNPVNDPPVAMAGLSATSLRGGVSVELQGEDVEGDHLTFTLPQDQSAEGGSLTLQGTSVTYIPPAGFSGNDSFLFKCSDQSSESDAVTVSLTVVAGGDVTNLGSGVSLEQVDNATGTVTFTLEAGTDNPLRVGDYLSAPTLLGQITAISQEGDEVTATTSAISLSDVVESGGYQTSNTYSSIDVDEAVSRQADGSIRSNVLLWLPAKKWPKPDAQETERSGLIFHSHLLLNGP